MNNVIKIEKPQIDIVMDKAWDDYIKREKNKKYPNIMILGITGAGKSSLINMIFEIPLAKTSNILPQTEKCIFYEGKKYNKKINLIDTAGYELDQSESYLRDIKTATHKEHGGLLPHVIWYCISIANERIEDMDLKALNLLKKLKTFNERICIVFTKCDEDDIDSTRENAYKEVLRQEGMAEIPTFEVSTEIDLQQKDLVTWSATKLQDNDLRYCFIASQMKDLESKEQEANNIIIKACELEAIEGACSVIGGQLDEKQLSIYLTEMITEIFKIYGLDTLAGLKKRFELKTYFISLCSKLADIITRKIPIIKFAKKGISVGLITGFVGGVGKAASKISRNYLEKHIKGEKVIMEHFFSDPSIIDATKKLINEISTKVEVKEKRQDQ